MKVIRWLLIPLLAGLGARGPDRGIAAARAHLGDRYDASYVRGGRPPKGRSACTDIVVDACLAHKIDLQQAIQNDAGSGAYGRLDGADIDHRRAPNLQVWMQRHARELPRNRNYLPGDFVFWSIANDGVADHCGVVSDRVGLSGKWQVIHQIPPLCVEQDCLGGWTVTGHFRLR